MSIDHVRRMRVPRSSILCAVLLLAAIGHPTDGRAQGDRESKLLSSRPAPRRSCSVAQAPRPLPALAELADSVQLATDVAAFARRYPLAGGDSSFALFSLAYGEGGRLERIAPIEYWLPQGQSEAFTDLVRRSLKLQERGGWSVRLRISATGTPVFRIGYSERCPPEATTRFSLTSNALASQQRPPQPVRLRAIITPEGAVGHIAILSSSGDRELDEWVRERLAQHGFRAGLLDGIAVTMDHEETVRIRTRP